MNKKITALFVSLAITLPAFGDCIRFNLSSQARTGKRYYCEVDSAELNATQSWNGKGAMPYDINAIVAAARDYYLTIHPDAKTIKVYDIAFSKDHHTAYDHLIRDKWLFTVQLEGLRGNPPLEAIMVFSNAKVVKRLETPK